MNADIALSKKHLSDGASIGQYEMIYLPLGCVRVLLYLLLLDLLSIFVNSGLGHLESVSGEQEWLLAVLLVSQMTHLQTPNASQNPEYIRR
jgi:hypothetical protein